MNSLPRPRALAATSALLALVAAAACGAPPGAPPAPSNATPPPPAAAAGDTQRPSRVVLATLDGLGDHLFRSDSAARELLALRRVASQGVLARGMIQSFPSVTPAGHAALWTGVYGNVSGIIAGSTPLLPRSDHTAFERMSGFDSRLLRVEPLWVTAARAGVRVVAHQTTQIYPFIPAVTAPDAPAPPVLVSGYGPAVLAPQAVIRARNVTATDPAAWGAALPRSALPPRTFRWTAGNVAFHGALVAENGREAGYTALYVAASPGGPAVRVPHAPTETEPPRGRDLARRFGEGLALEVGEAKVPTVGYFRLWELNPDGSEFLLYQTPFYELALHDGTPAAEADRRRLLAAAGGFLGNGPSYLYRDGLLGPQLYAGGDGTAERRYLEGVELVLRQYNRHSRWLAARYEPRLLIDYAPYPDELDHSWYGLVRPEVTGVDARTAAAFQRFRAWGYAAIDQRVALLDSLAGPAGTLIIGADHGMSPAARRPRVNVALRQAGLLALAPNGRIDPARTRAVHLSFCVLVNTADWKGGIVPLAERERTVGEVEAALAAVRDPETGARVVTQLFRPEQFGDSLGIGGPAGCDTYFELAPGYEPDGGLSGEVVERLRVPAGEHGFLPTRPEMLAVFVARGAGFPRGGEIPTIRSIDVAATVAEALGIPAPPAARGRSVLRRAVGRR